MSVTGVPKSKTPKGSNLCSVSARRFPLASVSAFALPKTFIARQQAVELHLVCLLHTARSLSHLHRRQETPAVSTVSQAIHHSLHAHILTVFMDVSSYLERRQLLEGRPLEFQVSLVYTMSYTTARDT